MTFTNNKAIKVVSVIATDKIRINDNTKYLSRVSGISKNNLTTEIYFELPNSKANYSLPINDGTFNDEFYYRNFRKDISNGKPVPMSLNVAIYQRKNAAGKMDTVFVVKSIGK